MPEEQPVAESTETNIPVVKVESKPADKPVAAVAKAPVVAKPAIDDKSKPVESKVEEKPVEDQKPSEELKTLLDEASEEEVKLDKDGNPIKEEAKINNVPEKYEFKLPEGMTLNETAMAIVDPIFKELGLNNEQAQKLVDVQLALNKQNEEKHVAEFNQYVEGLKSEAKTFFGPKLTEVMRNVARSRDQFIHKELQDKLNISGLSNDKDILVMLDKLGRVIGEGKFVDGKRSGPAAGKVGIETPTGKDATLAEVYPSMVQK